MTADQQEGHDATNRSLQQAEVWLIADPQPEIAKTHLLDALDEIGYQFTQLDQ